MRKQFYYFTPREKAVALFVNCRNFEGEVSTLDTGPLNKTSNDKHFLMAVSGPSCTLITTHLGLLRSRSGCWIVSQQKQANKIVRSPKGICWGWGNGHQHGRWCSTFYLPIFKMFSFQERSLLTLDMYPKIFMWFNALGIFFRLGYILFLMQCWKNEGKHNLVF